MDEYPKWIATQFQASPEEGPEAIQIIVNSKAEEDAIKSGKAKVRATNSAQGRTYEVVMPAPVAAPRLVPKAPEKEKPPAVATLRKK